MTTWKAQFNQYEKKIIKLRLFLSYLKCFFFKINEFQKDILQLNQTMQAKSATQSTSWAVPWWIVIFKMTKQLYNNNLVAWTEAKHHECDQTKS